jgi:hypothetical protein
VTANCPPQEAHQSSHSGGCTPCHGTDVHPIGAIESHTDGHCGIYFHIQFQIKVYAKVDDPPKRGKPIQIVIIIYILAQTYGEQCKYDDLAIVYMIKIYFDFLLHPCYFTGITLDDTPFRVQDVALYIGPRRLDMLQPATAELDAVISVS